MLEDKPQELGAGERSVFDPLRLTVAVPEGHLALFSGDDIFLLDHAFIQIPAEIQQCLLARADGLAVNDPFFRVLSLL